MAHVQLTDRPGGVGGSSSAGASSVPNSQGANCMLE